MAQTTEQRRAKPVALGQRLTAKLARGIAQGLRERANDPALPAGRARFMRTEADQFDAWADTQADSEYALA